MAPGQEPQGPVGWHLGNVLGIECLLVHHMKFLQLMFCLYHLSFHEIQMVLQVKALFLGCGEWGRPVTAVSGQAGPPTCLLLSSHRGPYL